MLLAGAVAFHGRYVVNPARYVPTAAMVIQGKLEAKRDAVCSRMPETTRAAEAEPHPGTTPAPVLCLFPDVSTLSQCPPHCGFCRGISTFTSSYH